MPLYVIYQNTDLFPSFYSVLSHLVYFVSRIWFFYSHFAPIGADME